MRGILAVLMFVPGLALAEPLKVVAVNAPLAEFARRLGGDAVAVTMPVPADQDPALWRPSIDEITAIQQSDLILLNGANYAGWTRKTALPRARTVNTSKAFSQFYIHLETGVTHSHGAEGAHSHIGTVGETWLDFVLALGQAETIAGALRRKLPEAKDDIDAELGELKADLMALHENFLTLRGGSIQAAAPGLDYLISTYAPNALRIDWGDDNVPDAAALRQAALTSDGVVLWPGEIPEGLAEALDATAIKLVQFDTGANTDQDFVSVMDANFARIQAALASE